MNFSLTKTAKNLDGVRALGYLRVSDLPAHFRFFSHFENERIDPLACHKSFFRIYCGWQSGKCENRQNKFAHFKLKIDELASSELVEIWKSFPRS